MSQGRFNINKLQEVSGDGSDADFIVLQRNVPKRYDLRLPMSSVTLVYHRGVTTKEDDTLLNLGTDTFTLPAGWQNKRQMILFAYTETGAPPNVIRILASKVYNIRALHHILLDPEDVTFTGDVQMVFNMETGVFAAAPNNANIDFIVLID